MLGIKHKRLPYRRFPFTDNRIGTTMPTKMSTSKLDRLRCTQCSKTYKEVKLLNRHRREKHSQEKRWPCDYPGCSVDFQCPRFKAEHVKNQHAEQIAQSLLPAEQPRPGFDGPGNIVPTLSGSSYEPPYALIAPRIPSMGASETPRSPPSLAINENLSTPSAVNTPKSPLGFSDDLGDHRAGMEAVSNRSQTQVAHRQAVITSIWDRDVERLSKIIDHREIDIEFREAATFRLVEELTQGTTERGLQRRESREAFASRPSSYDLLRILRVLTPVRLAITIGFLNGVICLNTRTHWPRQGLSTYMDVLTRACIPHAAPQDAAIAAFLSYDSRGATTLSFGDASSSSPTLEDVNGELALCCPDPNKDMPGGTKWLEHAIRRGNVAGTYILLQRGADRDAALADGTTLVNLALEKGQDKIAVLLLRPWLVVGRNVCESFFYRHQIWRSFWSGGDFQGAVTAVLMRLRIAAEVMKQDQAGAWRSSLQLLIRGILRAETKIREGIDVPHGMMDYWLEVEISHVL